MKRTAFILFVTAMPVLGALHAQTHTVVKKWASDTLFRTPESVLYDAKDKLLYVSNMDPASGDKGGKGSIGKLGLDGKIISLDWVTGLTSPKGMGLYKNELYAAELTTVVVIDINKAQIIRRIPVEGAVFLNDISVDRNGVVYVSDSKTMKIHKIENGKVSTLLQNMQGPNGVLAVGNELVYIDKGSLLKRSADGTSTKITDGMDPSTDGIEMVKPNEYLVSSWNGIVYYVHADGHKDILFDTRTEKINSADIGYDPKNHIMYVPTFFKNGVIAYEVK